jgi:hypothetical protein
MTPEISDVRKVDYADEKNSPLLRLERDRASSGVLGPSI